MRARRRRIFALSLLVGMPADASTTLKDWVEANTDVAEKLMCQRESNGEYFFVARAGESDKLRLGSRLDLSAYRPPHFSFSVAWMLRNEHDRSITAKIAPTVLKQEYLRAADNAHAESVEYQTINIGWSKRLLVDVVIEKCPSHPCADGNLNATRYTVNVCETPL
jgi:hypothetical protein